MIIFRLTDRVPVKIGEITFWLSPLSFEQKMNLSTCTSMQGGVEVVDGMKRAFFMLKYALKGVDGLNLMSGEEYKPAFDPNGLLSDEAVSEIANLGESVTLAQAIHAFMNDVAAVEKVPGVVVDFKEVKVAEKKG